MQACAAHIAAHPARQVGPGRSLSLSLGMAPAKGSPASVTHASELILCKSRSALHL